MTEHHVYTFTEHILHAVGKHAWACSGVVCLAEPRHFEILTDLTALRFLQCLTRFVPRRGFPSRMSDSASTFKSALRELLKTSEKVCSGYFCSLIDVLVCLFLPRFLQQHTKPHPEEYHTHSIVTMADNLPRHAVEWIKSFAWAATAYAHYRFNCTFTNSVLSNNKKQLKINNCMLNHSCSQCTLLSLQGIRNINNKVFYIIVYQEILSLFSSLKIIG